MNTQGTQMRSLHPQVFVNGSQNPSTFAHTDPERDLCVGGPIVVSLDPSLWPGRRGGLAAITSNLPIPFSPTTTTVNAVDFCILPE
jgi:hypothetical protein